MIYISTGGHRLKNAAETALDFYSHGIVGVELSGGTFSATYQADLLALPQELTLQVHNYFPPPENPLFNGDLPPISKMPASINSRVIRVMAVVVRPVSMAN